MRIRTVAMLACLASIYTATARGQSSAPAQSCEEVLASPSDSISLDVMLHVRAAEGDRELPLEEVLALVTPSCITSCCRVHLRSTRTRSLRTQSRTALRTSPFVAATRRSSREAGAC